MITPSKNSLDAGKPHEDRVRKLIIKALTEAKHPLSRRQLSKRTFTEISGLCQPLYDLVYKLESVKISYYGPCVTTKRHVMHFALNKAKTIGHDGNE
jgi:hypothetical protein